MTYHRVIPRALFNDANLLKCLGRLVILSETHPMKAEYQPVECCSDVYREGFNVNQNEYDGSTYCGNVTFYAEGPDITFYPFRPLNSKDEWPLYVDIGEETISVFDTEGNLSKEFTDWLNQTGSYAND